MPPRAGPRASPPRWSPVWGDLRCGDYLAQMPRDGVWSAEEATNIHRHRHRTSSYYCLVRSPLVLQKARTTELAGTFIDTVTDYSMAPRRRHGVGQPGGGYSIDNTASRLVALRSAALQDRALALEGQGSVSNVPLGSNLSLIHI